MSPFVGRGNFGEKLISYDSDSNDPRLRCATCPQCNKPFIFVNARKKLRHFRHVVESGCEWEPESQIHLYAKQWVYNRFGTYGEVEYEKKIGECIADVAFEGGGIKVAFEIQAQQISEEKYLYKNNNYLNNGYYPVWVLIGEQFLSSYRWENCYRLKEIERLFSPIIYYLIYYDHLGDEITKLRFKPKWAHGGDVCQTIYFKNKSWRISPKQLLYLISKSQLLDHHKKFWEA